MIPLASAEYRYTYYFNPKSASSTYRSLFVELHRGELPGEVNGAVDIHNAFQHFHPMAIGRSCNSFSYTIVRHPFPRMVSAYLDKCVEINAPVEQRFRKQDHMQWIFKPVFGFLGRAPNFDQGFSFIEFLRYLEQALRQRRPLDIHFEPQWNAKFALDAYYRIEDPIEDLLAIYRTIFEESFDQLDLERRIRETANNKLNRSFGEQLQPIYAGESLAGMNFAGLNSLMQQGLRFTYENFMTDESKSLISAIYAQELKAYDYSPDR
ncbi:hypothetical protein EY643_03050 [Halioglobus maricola]|uniref:Sulfotransferase family protein n=1 Tax=Halioglobus maricola TaxID=2601894 RepID=A0A5P9NGN7_9GAMM|nr:sulfotransferase family 2 domain-containing protein [Halioglobus maricola]QFU74715.1 hypothetical protein EY643_03050 [Halioglobus maricola]